MTATVPRSSRPPLSQVVIGISGHDGSGKSTLAASLVKALGEHNFSAGILSLARPLKEDMNTLGLSAHHKPTPPHMRDLLRAYGHAQRAENGLTYWLERWERARQASPAEVIVVDDLRHLNEYHWFSRRDAHIITLEVASVEPDPAVPQPAIVSEVWDVRAAALGTRGCLPARQHHAHATLGTPADMDLHFISLLNGVILPAVRAGYRYRGDDQ